MTEQTCNQGLLKFIEECPSSYHTIKTVTQRLMAEGFQPLSEGEPWSLTPGQGYFVTRNQSSVIAFRGPKTETPTGFMITASHSESPSFKIKPNGELTGAYRRLNVEPYGGMLYATWLDRPLSVAGRVVIQTETGIESRLVQVDRDLLLIPNLAIHMNRKANEGYAYRPHVDLLPLMGQGKDGVKLQEILAREAKTSADAILSGDLFLYVRDRGTIWGAEEEFISAPRLDDLQCVYGTLEGFLQGENPQTIPVYCVFDNEEVGSGTKQGAKSTFLRDTLQRLLRGYGLEDSYQTMLASGFMLSADNGHALHPNHPEMADETHRPMPNQGILLKHNANQKYTTDAISEALVRRLCEKAQVPVQSYTNRSDIPGGSTLGNLSSEKVSLNMADIGLAQLAMHSAYETAGTKDTLYLCQLAKTFYQTALIMESDGSYTIK